MASDERIIVLLLDISFLIAEIFFPTAKPEHLQLNDQIVPCITPFGERGFCQYGLGCPKEAHLQRRRVPWICLQKPGTVCCPFVGESLSEK